MAVIVFLGTLSFIASTPGFNVSTMVDQFLFKDITLLGASIWALGEARSAANHNAQQALRVVSCASLPPPVAPSNAGDRHRRLGPLPYERLCFLEAHSTAPLGVRRQQKRSGGLA